MILGPYPMGFADITNQDITRSGGKNCIVLSQELTLPFKHCDA
jgi:hypothetical protein